MKKSLITIFAVAVTVIAMAAGTKVWMYSHSGNHLSMDIADFDSLSFVEPGLLEINPIEKKIGNEGGRFTLEITANKPWTASSNDPAVILGTTKGTGNAKIACTAMPNTEEEPYTAIITVTLEDGTYKQALVTVGEIKVEITLKKLTVYVNEPDKLQYTTVPSGVSINQFSLSSSDTSIATVDPDGTVHGIRVGTSTITAKYGNTKSSCTVSVYKRAVTSVTLSKTSHTFSAIGQTIQLTATVLPSNATYPAVTWRSSDSSVATVENDGRVTSKGVGIAYITATADGRSSTCIITVDGPNPEGTATFN